MNKFWSRETSRSWSRQAWCQTASASVLQRYGVEIADPEVDGLTGPRWWELRSTFKTAEKCKRTHATILQTHTIPVFHSQDRTHRDCKQDSALTTLDHVQFSTFFYFLNKETEFRPQQFQGIVCSQHSDKTQQLGCKTPHQQDEHKPLGSQESHKPTQQTQTQNRRTQTVKTNSQCV
jgi:hypothetical protein